MQYGTCTEGATQYMAACELPKSSDQPAVKLALILRLPPITSRIIDLTVNMRLEMLVEDLAMQMNT